MKTIEINKELEIRRNPWYKEITRKFTIDQPEIKSWIYSMIQTGKVLERNYSIRRDKECQAEQDERIKTYSDIEIRERTEMVQEIHRLAKENVALKKALQESDIRVQIIDTHRKEKEEI